jgi:hypothetical protein
MKQILTSKLFRKVLTLAFLLISLGFVISSNKTVQPVYAAPCCEECDAQLSYCLEECTTSACRRACFEDNNNCSSHCVMCGGGGGGGCLTSSDCPYIQGYGFGYCVGGNCVY